MRASLDQAKVEVNSAKDAQILAEQERDALILQIKELESKLSAIDSKDASRDARIKELTADNQRLATLLNDLQMLHLASLMESMSPTSTIAPQDLRGSVQIVQTVPFQENAESVVRRGNPAAALPTMQPVILDINAVNPVLAVATPTPAATAAPVTISPTSTPSQPPRTTPIPSSSPVKNWLGQQATASSGPLPTIAPKVFADVAAGHANRQKLSGTTLFSEQDRAAGMEYVYDQNFWYNRSGIHIELWRKIGASTWNGRFIVQLPHPSASSRTIAPQLVFQSTGKAENARIIISKSPTWRIFTAQGSEWDRVEFEFDAESLTLLLEGLSPTVPHYFLQRSDAANDTIVEMDPVQRRALLLMIQSWRDLNSSGELPRQR